MSDRLCRLQVSREYSVNNSCTNPWSEYCCLELRKQPCKYEEPVSVPRIHVKEPGIVVCACDPTVEKETGPSDL